MNVGVALLRTRQPRRRVRAGAPMNIRQPVSTPGKASMPASSTTIKEKDAANRYHSIMHKNQWLMRFNGWFVG
jgi:hypothetical protein